MSPPAQNYIHNSVVVSDDSGRATKPRIVENVRKGISCVPYMHAGMNERNKRRDIGGRAVALVLLKEGGGYIALLLLDDDDVVFSPLSSFSLARASDQYWWCVREWLG